MEGTSEADPVGGREGHRRDFGAAIALWFAEIAVSVTPLLAYGVIHAYASLPGVLARCQAIEAKFADCLPVNDGPDAEICILAVVISRLSFLPLTRPRAAPIDPFRAISAAGLASLILLAGTLYALISAGISRNTQEVVWWTLGGALIGSFLLALERAARP